MSDGDAAPLTKEDGTTFHAEYDASRPESSAATYGLSGLMRLSQTSGQYFYRAIHAPFTPWRLPPRHAQLEDCDVFALMKMVFQDGHFSAEWLHENWSGVFDSRGYIHPARRQMGRPAVSWDKDRFRYVCINGTYTLCGEAHLEELIGGEMLRTTKKGKNGFPWCKPRSSNLPTGLRENAKKGKVTPLFGIDEDLELRFDLIVWPKFVDHDRMSARMWNYLTNDERVVLPVFEVVSSTQWRPPTGIGMPADPKAVNSSQREEDQKWYSMSNSAVERYSILKLFPRNGIEAPSANMEIGRTIEEASHHRAAAMANESTGQGFNRVQGASQHAVHQGSENHKRTPSSTGQDNNAVKKVRPNSRSTSQPADLASQQVSSTTSVPSIVTPVEFSLNSTTVTTTETATEPKNWSADAFNAKLEEIDVQIREVSERRAALEHAKSTVESARDALAKLG